MVNSINRFMDLIDSRDVIARIEELESDREYITSQIEELSNSTELISDIEMHNKINELKSELQEWDDSDDSQELKVLQSLAKEGESSPDWQYGETLIRDSYFVEYAQELAEDIGAIDRDVKWPYTCIDWEWAARELKYDYMLVEFDGIDYWIRA